MVFRFRGVPVREVNGLPYAVHQIGENEWQIVIENCTRLPAGYRYAAVYGSHDEALQALNEWPEARMPDTEKFAGDDTSAVYLTDGTEPERFE